MKRSVLTLAARGASRAGIRPALHPTSRRCSSLKYDPIFSVVAPGDLGASPVSVLRRHFHHGLLALVLLYSLSISAELCAGEAAPANPYSGDLWTRSTLTGDWGGFRNERAEKGVTFDLSITQIGQGVVDGGKSGAWQYGGRGDIVMNAG